MTTMDTDNVKPVVDYKNLPIESLIEEFKQKLETLSVADFKEEANAIRSSFYFQYNEDLAKAKAVFDEQEGAEEAVFEYENQALQVTFKELWKTYLNKKNEYHAQLTKELESNLAKKESIILAIKTLVEKGDVSGSYQDFKKLQEDWKSVGSIVSDKYQETWGNYNLYVEQFYDLLHLNNDLRSAEFKNNLQIKQSLIEKAKELLNHDDIQFAFSELQVLHKIWKEDTGPVDREFRESVWEEFSEITNKLHDKKTVFFDELRKQEELNFAAKLAKIEEIKSFDYSKSSSFSDWKKNIEAFDQLKSEFIAIGKVPKNKNSEVWDLFKDATKLFNTAKNNFFKDTKKSQSEALGQKKALIQEALEWSKSEDYETATDNLKRIQAAWKKVGFVPRKQADALWNEFRAICDAHFDKLKQIKKEGTPEEQENYNKKLEFLEGLSDVEITPNTYLKVVKDWLSIGKGPNKKNKVDQDIQQAIAASLEESDNANSIKYQLKIAYLKAIDSRKFYDEHTQLRKEKDQAIKDLKQLENNLGFFANTKKANPLLDNVLKSIETEKEKVEVLKQRIKFVNSL